MHSFSLKVPFSLFRSYRWEFIISSIFSREGDGTPLQYSCLENPMDRGAWWAAVHGVAKSRTWLSNFTFTFHFHAVEKEMATHSSVLAWRIPGTGKPGGLPSMGSHRVGHDWSDLTAAAAAAASLHLCCSMWTTLTPDPALHSELSWVLTPGQGQLLLPTSSSHPRSEAVGVVPLQAPSYPLTQYLVYGINNLLFRGFWWLSCFRHLNTIVSSLVAFGWGSRNESGQKSSEPLLMEPGSLSSWDGGEQTSCLTSFVKATSHPALMWMDQLDSSWRLNVTAKQVRDCHLRSMERPGTSDRMPPRLIELHHGTRRDQPGCSIFLETVISHLFAFMSWYPWSWRRQWHPTPVLLPGKSLGRRSLVGCSPWGR